MRYKVVRYKRNGWPETTDHITRDIAMRDHGEQLIAHLEDMAERLPVAAHAYIGKRGYLFVEVDHATGD